MTNSFLALAHRGKNQVATVKRYVSVTSLIGWKLLYLYPVRCAWIVVFGLVGFLLQVAAIIVLVRLLIDPETAREIDPLGFAQELSNFQVMLIATGTMLTFYLMGVIFSYLSSLYSVQVAQKFAQESLRHTMKVYAQAFIQTPLRLHTEVAPFSLRELNMRSLNYIYRALDSSGRVCLLAMPRIFSSIAAGCFLFYLNWQITFVVMLLVISFGGVIAWQSARGLNSRRRLERNISEAIQTRRLALELINDPDTDLCDIERSIDRSIDTGPGRTISREYAFQFSILYESNAATSILTAVMLGFVVLLLLLQAKPGHVPELQSFWVAAGTYLVGLRFLAGELMPVTKSVVSISRLYEHLARYAEIVRFESGKRKNHRTAKSGDTGRPRLVVRSNQPNGALLADFPDREHSTAEITLSAGDSSLLYLPTTADSFDFRKLANFASFEDGAAISGAQAEVRTVLLDARRIIDSPVNLRSHLQLSGNADAEAIAQQIASFDLPDNMLGDIQLDLDSPRTPRELARLTAEHKLLIQLVDAAATPAYVVVVSASILIRLRKCSSKARDWLKQAFGQKIVFLVPETNTEAKEFSGETRYAVALGPQDVLWIGDSKAVSFADYRDLLDTASQEPAQKDAVSAAVAAESDFSEM